MPSVDDSARDWTKLTVMMGGHYYAGREQLPNTKDLVEQAKETINMHLGIEEEPVFAQAHMQKSCIPQYGVGHVDRMTELDASLRKLTPGVSVVGASYTGVSVNDCIYHALALGDRIARDTHATGLEAYLEGM